MFPCESCAYKRCIPGDEHIQCEFDWSEEPTPKFSGNFMQQRWYLFPLNYDPVLGPEACNGFSSQDQAHVAPMNPMMELVGLLAKRL